MNERDKVIQIALNEIGYLEKKSNSQLYDKTANAGYNNYTKYNAEMMKINAGIYVNGYPWCDTFVDWCFVTAFGKERAKELLYDWSAYTPTSANYFKQKKQWFTNPEKGDIIFFKNSKEICHTGIVYTVDSKYVYTIEGNTSTASCVEPNGGLVAKKHYLKTNSGIAGYGRPKYKEEKEEIPMTEKIYNKLEECPEWSRPYVYKAYELKWLKGDGVGLNLNDSKIFTLVIMLRALNIME